MTNVLDMAAAIAAAPYIARAEEAERVRAARHEHEITGSAGKSFYIPPRAPKTREQVIRDGLAAYRKAVAFGQSPRGRFLLALRELQDLGWKDEAEKVRACGSRGFLDEDQPANAREIGRALAALERIDHSAARVAGLALAEILAGEVEVAA